MNLPEWLDRGEYPFDPKEFETPVGMMRYVDEGDGPPIVMVHGNPYWSFEYRRLVRRFSQTHRCIAPDHIGFGLSDKPADWDYLPVHHAENLEALLESLDLSDVTVVVNDWGGPIGLSYAIAHPVRVARIVITNTWCWSVADDWYYRAFSGFVGGPLGRILIRRRNFFARTIVRSVFGDSRNLTPELHRHITAPLATPDERRGSWVFPREIIGSSEWLAGLWSARELLRGKVRLIAWGMKDIAFREKELATWAESFPEARVVRFPAAGHFVAEEAGEELGREMERIL
jgi:haloalkane dehalogenase